MDSASRPHTRSSSPWLPRGFAAFLVAALVLGLCVLLLQERGYLSDRALAMWAKVLAFQEGPESRIEYLGLVYPHLPAYLLLLLKQIPGLASPSLPYVASALAGATLLALWYRDLSPRAGAGFAWLCLLLMALHPFFLWPATAGTNLGLGLLFYYLLGRGLRTLTREGTPQAFISFGGLLAMAFIVDERALFLAPSLFLLFPLLMPKDLLRRAPFSLALVLFTPFVIGILAWAYMNWLFMGDPWSFLHNPDSAFRGAFFDQPFSPWLRAFGGEFLSPFLISIGLTIATFPVLLALTPMVRLRPGLARSGFVLLGAIFIATALGTMFCFLAHPVEMLFLASATMMHGVVLIAPRRRPMKLILASLLVLGTFGGWAVFTWRPSPSMVAWTVAWQRHLGPQPFLAEAELGHWLALQEGTTLVDDRLAYPAIVAMGHTRNLWLPHTRTFKTALARALPDATQIVLPDPSGRGHRDSLNVRYPEAYEKGLPGFERVFDRGGWRVYRQIQAIPETPAR